MSEEKESEEESKNERERERKRERERDMQTGRGERKRGQVPRKGLECCNKCAGDRERGKEGDWGVRKEGGRGRTEGERGRTFKLMKGLGFRV